MDFHGLSPEMKSVGAAKECRILFCATAPITPAPSTRIEVDYLTAVAITLILGRQERAEREQKVVCRSAMSVALSAQAGRTGHVATRLERRPATPEGHPCRVAHG